MKPADIRELTEDEMREQIAQIQEELFRLRFRAATQPLEDSALIGKLRKDIARLKTVLRERELGAARVS